MKLNTPIRRGTPDWQREMIEMETEDDSEILDAHHQSEVASSLPTPPESTPPAADEVYAPEEIGIQGGVPFLHRPERADEQAAVSLGVALRVRQAGA